MRTPLFIFLLFCSSLFGVEHVYLKTPDLSRENILSVIVGIRPYRKTGVRLEPELFGDKLLIHHYGYGGSGLTLCLGGSKEVLNILHSNRPPSPQTVAILGAGVAGLATAYDLLKEGYEVHLYADQWSPHLTSNVAAGIWTPEVLSKNAPEEKKALCQQLLETAKQRLQNSLGPDPEFEGVSEIECYRFRKQTDTGDEVIVHFDNGVVKPAKKTTELIIDGKLFIEGLLAKIQALGAQLHERRFDTKDEILSLEESIIVNCTSMGSRTLFNDPEFVPVRGQMIHFKPQEGIDYIISESIAEKKEPSKSFWVSINPWSDRFILGGVYERGEKELTTTTEVLEQILENGRKCLNDTLN